ncbi:hypothetical protein AB6A40_008868 [Gnathostoma spinigerum]|uniref:Uncharacterized protein n=1 Tax=Gnathostoma spinigerum TaxID=75299 RepID=A0ABD6EY28_9BILA
MFQFAPTFSYVLRSGCDAHLSKIQPAYESYLATDATFLFDTAAMCFATMRGGPIWSFLFYTANLFFSFTGPVVIYILLIYAAFLEQFPIVEHFTTQFIGLISFVFATTSLLLCIPMGTSFGTLLQYASQASITQILMFFIVFFFFVYG